MSAPTPARSNCSVCGYPGPLGTGGQPCAVAQPNVRIAGCLLQMQTPSPAVQAIQKFLDEEIGHFNFEEVTPRLIATVLDNLPREVMVEEAAAVLREWPPLGAYAMVDRVVRAARRSVLGHE